MNLKKLIFGMFLLLVGSSLFAQNKQETDILFVGNSFTYFWNMPQMLEAMAEGQGLNLKTTQSTVGGSTLEEHFNKKKNTQTIKLLDSVKYDYVVLQDHSLATIDHPKDFSEYSKKLTELIREKGAKPVLYMTWGYHSNPLLQEKITPAYNNMAKELSSKVIPVGPIFMKARQLRPNLNLYFDDKHPSPEGSYLIALVFYKAFTGKSVLDIPDSLTTKAFDGEPLYLMFISSETGSFLRQLVEGFEFNSINFITE
jgi:hypothetical protein